MKTLLRKFFSMPYSKTKIIEQYVTGIKNWPKTILFLFGIIKEMDWNFKSLGKIRLFQKDKEIGIMAFLLEISNQKISSDQKDRIKNIMSQRFEEVLNIDGINIRNNEISIIMETFGIEQYKLNKGRGEYVIDIGANRGDSTLYFANKGYNVIGFEPVHELYEQGVANINLNNNLKKRIKFVKKAVSCENGKTKIYYEDNLDNNSGQSGIYTNTKKYELVDTITIDTILKNYNIEANILKMDCEGCEKDIILNSDLSKFKIIYFEYHTIFTKISPFELIKNLESQGFELSPEYTKNTLPDDLGVVKMIKTNSAF